MEDEILISAKDLSRFYGPTCAVKDVSFEVRRGEVLGFLGPNGAGKTTTMQMLTGNLAPSHGQILINNIDILDKPKIAKAKLGYLAEQPPLYKELTVDEYLNYCMRLNRIDKSKYTQAMDYAKQRCGLSDVGRRLIGNLSKGFQQRVGIAQAIIHSPDVVILDEPTIGLDPIQIREIRALIRELGNEHSVVLSTHILPEVQATCDRVQIINKGELVLTDSVAGLELSMKVSSLILGLAQPPAMEILSELDNVESVEPMDEHRFRIRYAPDKDPTELLVHKAVENSWGLRELSPERRSLEDIFVDITTTEHSPADKDHGATDPDEERVA